MTGVVGPQLVHHVFEKFVVPALIGTHGQAIRIFLNGGVHQLLHGAVVPQVNDFSTLALQQAANHVDRGVVSVEQGRTSYKTQRRAFGVSEGFSHLAGAAFHSCLLDGCGCFPPLV